MIRFHLIRQVQVSHCDIEARCASVDYEVPELERLLELREDNGSIGSNWIFVGIEILPRK